MAPINIGISAGHMKVRNEVIRDPGECFHVGEVVDSASQGSTIEGFPTIRPPRRGVQRGEPLCRASIKGELIYLTG